MVNSENRARLLLVGDVNSSLQEGGLQFLLRKTAPALRKADIVYGNLEFAITDRSEPVRAKHWTAGFAKRSMKPEEVSALPDAGFNVMSLANNHVMDFGPEGLRQTIALLESYGISHCGGGASMIEARKPAVIERKGLCVAFLSYTSVFAASYPATRDRPGVATVKVQTSFTPHPRTFEQPGTPPIVTTKPDAEEVAAMQADIRAARSSADVVIVSWHWGVSKCYQRAGYQMELGRAAIDAGADIVVGHHPHVLQGVEIYRRGVVLYSVGNFVFSLRPGGSPPVDRNSVLVDCTLGARGLEEVALRPVRINDQLQPELIEGDGGTANLRTLVDDSREFGTIFSDRGDRLVIEMQRP